MSKNKLSYEMVLTGKAERKMWRLRKKKAKKGIGSSPLGKMRSRQERKAMAKSLKVPFQPRYNGILINKPFSLIETLKDGKLTGYTKLIQEVK